MILHCVISCNAKVLAFFKMIDVVKARIIDQNKSISQIAYELGFKYPQHFSRLFKQRVKQSPYEYRTLESN